MSRKPGPRTYGGFTYDPYTSGFSVQVLIPTSLLLIDTGITDQAGKVAAKFLGERLIAESFLWCGDFPRARNFALDAAARHDAEWAKTLDRDERLAIPV